MKLRKKAIVMMILAVVLVLSGCTQKTGENFSGQITQAHNRENTSSITQGIAGKEIGEAVMKDNVQEVDLKINVSGYFPDTIIAKKGTPLRINVHSDTDAGCATDIVFPDFNIEKIIPAGSSDVIEISPSMEGTFNFRCSMDMFRGKLIITE